MDLAPHFLQVGNAPVFVGDGADDVVCRCASSVLVRRHRPGTLLAIDIQCAACSAVTTIPGLPAGQVLAGGARVAQRNRLAVPEPLVLAPGMVLADRDELVRLDRLTTPRDIPPAPFEMSAATLAAAAADYDRLSAGNLAAHRRAVGATTVDTASGLGHLPLAWALERLAPGVERPGWWCLAEEPDAVAAVQLGAFREFCAVWSQHPLFPAMAAGVAASGFSTHALAVFAAARNMAADGNRISFSPFGIPPAGPAGVPPNGPPGGASGGPLGGPSGNPLGNPMGNPAGAPGSLDGFHIETGPMERLPVLVRRFDRFDWPGGAGVNQATARTAAIDTLIATQTRINPRQPGFLVLSVGAVRRPVDMPVIEGLQRTLHERGRRHRALAGVALMLPKIYPTDRSDRVVFGWIFLPIPNPHHSGTGVRFAAPPGAGTPPPGATLPPPTV